MQPSLIVRMLPVFFLFGALQAADPPPKALPLPGENFLVEGRPAFVIPPTASTSLKPTPWVWYAPTLPGLPGGAEKWMFERFTQAGIAIAGIDVGESYGSPDGRALFTALYRELTEKRGFSPKPMMLGRSRGGLMTLAWAVENPDKVSGFAGVYPVCNVASYPGIARAAGAYKMTPDELTQKLSEHNPIDRLAGLAKAEVPLFAIHGDVDKVVPLDANSGEMKKRYEALGGKMTLIVPAGQGHNMWEGFFQCQDLVDFVITQLTGQIVNRSDAAGIELASGGQSAYVIDLPPSASDPAKQAAAELKRVLKLATGVDLPVVHGARSPAIRLRSLTDGATDSFRINREGADIVIEGKDAEKPSKPGDNTWFVPSRGTFFGAMEFLERFAGARWLLPGEFGEDVPASETLRVNLDEPITGAPGFEVRSLAYVGESDPGPPGRPKSAVLDWMRRQRLTNAVYPQVAGYGHAWDDYLKPADIEAHPEWKPSGGEAIRNGKVTFFCTTAPGLVEAFAARVIESLDRYPDRPMASISPTDGGGFCQCARCEAMVSPDPHGRPNRALAILTFYKGVAEIVARERPGRRLGGFVYYNYQYPPSQPPKLPGNLSLCWAPLNYYGYGLLKPVYRDEFDATMARWSGVTNKLFYHNYSTWMRSFHGAPLPPALEILRHELPAAKKHGAWGARMVGTAAWGVNGAINYTLARQMWDPSLDPGAVLDEWLARAYGPGWTSIRAVHDDLDARMATHKAAESPVYKGSMYEVNEEVMKAIYAPAFPSIERNYIAALAACATEPQRKRLEMLGDNLTQMHYALRKAGLIDGAESSGFFRDDAAFAAFLAKMEAGFSLHRDGRGIDHGPIWKGEWKAP
jgi:hypothetical protein